MMHECDNCKFTNVPMNLNPCIKCKNHLGGVDKWQSRQPTVVKPMDKYDHLLKRIERLERELHITHWED
jgi:hypothetical protein